MATEKLECNVAADWLLRYLSGELEGKPEGEEFEEHVRGCETCRGLVADRRKAVQTLLMLSEQREQTEVSKMKPSLALTQWLAKKPAVALVALAVALIGFSQFSRAGVDLFGERVIDTLPPAETVAAAHATEPEDALPDMAEEEDETQAAIEATEEEPELPAEEPDKVAPRPTNPRPAQARRVAPPRPAPQPQASSVEVFDENGRKLGEVTGTK